MQVAIIRGKVFVKTDFEIFEIKGDLKYFSHAEVEVQKLTLRYVTDSGIAQETISFKSMASAKAALVAVYDLLSHISEFTNSALLQLVPTEHAKN